MLTDLIVSGSLFCRGKPARSIVAIASHRIPDRTMVVRSVWNSYHHFRMDRAIPRIAVRRLRLWWRLRKFTRERTSLASKLYQLIYTNYGEKDADDDAISFHRQKSRFKHHYERDNTDTHDDPKQSIDPRAS